jgi:hypothetical protein
MHADEKECEWSGLERRQERVAVVAVEFLLDARELDVLRVRGGKAISPTFSRSSTRSVSYTNASRSSLPARPETSTR